MGSTLTLLTLTHLKEQYMQTCECVGSTIMCVSVKVVPIAIGRYSNNKFIKEALADTTGKALSRHVRDGDMR
jgi:hypothetical protein